MSQGTRVQLAAQPEMQSENDLNRNHGGGCSYGRACSLEELDPMQSGEDSRWTTNERTIHTMRTAIEQEAIARQTAEIGTTAATNMNEDVEVMLIEQAQAHLAAHVAFVFASYGVPTTP
ncbi:hypothetical protein CPB86DRAFT_782103 [Serendipita vermifera]|nr:hypothetical protein CPB86DRAFT_782103 [Serendipita vermifera]